MIGKILGMGRIMEVAVVIHAGDLRGKSVIQPRSLQVLMSLAE